MLIQLFTIARNALVESLRQPILVVLVLLSGVFQVFSVWGTGFSMGMMESGEIKGDDKLMFDFGLGTVFVMGTLIAGFIATAVMSREIENKTVLTVVSKPVGRPVLVLGKFMGVAGAVMAASVVMLAFLLLGIRHQVMSTAADDLDQPVLVFGLGSVGLALVIAAWCNFYYGWNFPQTMMGLLVPFVVVAYVLVLCISKKWAWQSPLVDFKPKVFIACICLPLAILVLTSAATAASTRLGQVMTIVVCMGIFMLSLLSNYLFGRHVFHNDAIGVVRDARPETFDDAAFAPGDRYEIEFTQAPKMTFSTGANVYYGPTPNGFPLMTDYAPMTPPSDLSDANALLGPGSSPGVIVEKASGRRLTMRRVGPTTDHRAAARPPEPGDYIFARATGVNYPALAAWGVVPNLQMFWLLDAVTQNRPIPPDYLFLCVLYAGVQVTAFLAVAVLLFQTRDVG